MYPDGNKVKNNMRKRKNLTKTYLSDEEDDILKNLCERAGRSKSCIIRNMIKGYRLSEKPDKEFYDAINQLNRLNANVNQIRLRLNTGGSVTDEMLLDVMDDIRHFTNELREVYVLPRKYDNLPDDTQSRQ